jgi:hypothetical protein
MSSVSRPNTTGRLLSFNTEVSNGIEIIDHIERRRCRVNTQYNTSSTNTSTEMFHFPVDRGISIETSELSLPYSVAVSVRNHAGLMIDQLTSGDCQHFPQGQYNIGFSTQIKLYFVVDSSFRIEITSDHVVIEFENPTEVSIGARSHHEHPAGTITTPPDPEKMMEAVSYLTSSLKTTLCERSYPTLRGHPPKITLGDELHVPQVLKKPKTGVEIEIQPDYRSIYVISPLAYYIGADIVPGNSHVIRTAHGFSHSLDDTHRNLENEVKRVLKQCFFLDCLTRTEGYYKVSLYEREQLEEELNLDFVSLYNKTLPEQIEEYLQIPFGLIEPYIPKWKKTAYIETAPDHVEALPFLIHDLAAIHSAGSTDIIQSEIKKSKDTVQLERVSGVDTSKRRRGQGDLIRGDALLDKTRSGKSIEPEEYVEIPDDDALEQTWVGDGIPVGASKSMTTAFKNRLQRNPVDDNIEISVVVNDTDMMEEGEVVDDVYGSREQLGLNADIHRQLTTDELYQLLQQNTDFLHYIGHIDSDGFECIDGSLDVTEISNVGIDSFFLNACSSYQQAIDLINAGSIAGIATFKPVLNSGAERVGKTVARLLNLGFPLIASLSIAKSKSLMGDNYVVIGDGGLDLTQPISGSPSMCDVTKVDNEFSINYNTYLTRKQSIGSITMPNIIDNQYFYLTSGSTGEFKLGVNDLLRFLSEEKMPVRLESKLHWNDEISVNKLMPDT